MKAETRQWLQIAEGDALMAKAALDLELHSFCIFHCQQALEKVMKAMWLEGAEHSAPPRLHNLPRLAEEVGILLSREQQAFLDDLSRQYNPSRYADEAVDYTQAEAQAYYKQAMEIFAWLRLRLS